MGQRSKEDDTGYKEREVWSQVGELGIQKCTDLCFFISKLNIPLRQKRTGSRRMELALYWQGYLLQSKQPATSPELELFLLFSIQFFFVLFFCQGKNQVMKIQNSLMTAAHGFFFTASTSQWWISLSKLLTGNLNTIMHSFILPEREDSERMAEKFSSL